MDGYDIWFGGWEMWDKMVVEADLTGEWPGGISSSYKTTQATPI